MFLNRLVTRDISALKPDRVTYVVWCNDEGKVLDDGTIFHIRPGEYRLCSQHHQLDWLLLSSLGMDVCIEEETHEVAALSVQGPTSCSVLKAAGFSGLDELKPFGIAHKVLQGMEVMISRTGFTGDLGYELWTTPDRALDLWDAIFGLQERGLYNVRAIGLGALELVRIEAGFIMPGDDFNTAETTVRAGHDRSPFELGLDWVVNFDKAYFTGKRALLEEQNSPIQRRLLKLQVAGNKPPADSFCTIVRMVRALAPSSPRSGRRYSRQISPWLMSNTPTEPLPGKSGPKSITRKNWSGGQPGLNVPCQKNLSGYIRAVRLHPLTAVNSRGNTGSSPG